MKTLRKRIQSVKSTQKITKAMKVVSAAKLRVTRGKAESAAPYAKKMASMTAALAAGTQGAASAPLLTGNGSRRSCLVAVCSADRGLCGSFNSALLRKAKTEIGDLIAAGISVSVITVGKKVYAPLKAAFPSVKIEQRKAASSYKSLPFSTAEDLAAEMISRFEKGEADVCKIIFAEFVNALIQRPVTKQLIPLTVQGDVAGANVRASDEGFEYEPDQETMLNAILPKNVAVQCYHALLENAAGEHAARMAAMDNASRNAQDMVAKLTLKYNRSRQATITKELIEVISGAEAV